MVKEPITYIGRVKGKVHKKMGFQQLSITNVFTGNIFSSASGKVHQIWGKLNGGNFYQWTKALKGE